jgi:hypothetical protein
MLNLRLQDIGTVLDAIGITLCLVIICYLIFNRVKRGRLERRRETDQEFGDQVMQCMVSQQIRRVLTAVMAKVDEELHWLAAASPTSVAAGDELPQWFASPAVSTAGQKRLAGSAIGADNGSPEWGAAADDWIEAETARAAATRPERRPVAEIELCAWIDRHRSKKQEAADTGGRQ